jgi:hypothetical protein
LDIPSPVPGGYLDAPFLTNDSKSKIRSSSALDPVCLRMSTRLTRKYPELNVQYRFKFKVRIGKILSDKFPIQNELKQGAALSPLLFNFALEYAIVGLELDTSSILLC